MENLPKKLAFSVKDLLKKFFFNCKYLAIPYLSSTPTAIYLSNYSTRKCILTWMSIIENILSGKCKYLFMKRKKKSKVFSIGLYCIVNQRLVKSLSPAGVKQNISINNCNLLHVPIGLTANHLVA